MSYKRVIPRDLFNEAKLLKCLGRLVLRIHDGFDLGGLAFTHDGAAFQVEQDPSDGGLYVANLKFSFAGTPLELRTQYNSKDDYPLLCFYGGGTDAEFECPVFNDEGSWDAAFLDLIERLREAGL